MIDKKTTPIISGMKEIRNKRGSSAVLLAMIFVAFAICITGSVTISRKLVVKSECETFGRLWTKAILSEYDLHLLDDYALMAYFGNDTDVGTTIDKYIDYSVSGKLGADFKATAAELTGYELGDPANFSKALDQSFAGSTAEVLLNGGSRHKRAANTDAAEEQTENHKIGNTVVLDTMPSAGMGSSEDAGSVADRLSNIGSSDGIRSMIRGAGTETAFIWQHFGNNVTYADDKKSFFRNEWEYILAGKPDDNKNLESCRHKLFLIRNALDLASLYKDPEKVELITAAAELITPGPLGAVTQVIIAEAWAALEAEADLKSLYEYERVPVLKTAGQWKTGLESVLSSDDVRKKLGEEALENMSENHEELDELGRQGDPGSITDGLNYDEYLMFMILLMKKDVRLLRIMDLVQINMKFRYYRDFNLDEYYTGVRYTIRANGRDYCFEDSYR